MDRHYKPFDDAHLPRKFERTDKNFRYGPPLAPKLPDIETMLLLGASAVMFVVLVLLYWVL